MVIVVVFYEVIFFIRCPSFLNVVDIYGSTIGFITDSSVMNFNIEDDRIAWF